MSRKVIFASLCLLFFVGTAASASISSVPSFLDIGEVDPGETVEQEVYITTNYDSNFTISPSVSNGRDSLKFRESFDTRFETSEQDIDSWVEVEDNIEVDPSNRFTVELEDGSYVVRESFTITIDVPSDAEPGYHYGYMRLNPSTGTSSGAGTTNWGETPMDFRFRVDGEAERDIIVQDVRGFRLGEENAAVELLLSNQGTVTTSTDSFELDILDSSGEVSNTLKASGAELEPGESQWVEASWSEDEGIEEGSYQVDGEVDYFTGSAYASGSFSLPDFDVVEVRPDDSPAVDEGEQGSAPLWLVVMVLVIFGVLMWSFGIDPFWILLIIGVFGISAFILMSGLSNILLVVLLIVVGIVVYGGL